jgi:hypothetical protein
MAEKLIITPKTKILDLITEYPQLEEVLFEMSSAFKQLKNPVLRKTVARVTTLQQAALVGGIKVEDLVNRLRREVNADADDHSSPDLVPDTDARPSMDPVPAWYSPDKVTRQLDAREMLNRGEHPVGQVLADLQHLAENEIYELIAPFFPAPLIDKASALGFSNYVISQSSEEFHVYFSK